MKSLRRAAALCPILFSACSSDRAEFESAALNAHLAEARARHQKHQDGLRAAKEEERKRSNEARALVEEQKKAQEEQEAQAKDRQFAELCYAKKPDKDALIEAHVAKGIEDRKNGIRHHYSGGDTLQGDIETLRGEINYLNHRLDADGRGF
jgi:hypothetical protein